MDTKEFRRQMHRCPELSKEEYQTSRFISDSLAELGIEFRPIAGTGVLARVEGRRGNLKRCVVLRAEIDALPIQEIAAEEWSSEREGVMHACGHDFHAAMLYGVLKRLHLSRDFEGTLMVLFQPAEEFCSGGALKVLEEEPFKDYDVAAVIGQHVDSSLEVGELGFCPGKFMASIDEMSFTIDGVGGNAAQRSQIKDSVVAMADLVMRLNTLNSDVCVVSTCKVEADGGDDNIVPDRSRCECVMSVYDEGLRSRIKEMIGHIAQEIEYKYDVEVEFALGEGNPCVENNAQLSYEAMILADSCGYKVCDLDSRPTTDDFGYFSQIYPSLYYSLGVGQRAGRKHTATFMPDERALEVGEEFMWQLALSILNK